MIWKKLLEVCMNSFVFENNQFVYTDDVNRKVLLDCNKYLENFSRIPFHSINDGITIPKIIFDLLTWHSRVFEGTKEQELGIYYALIDVLVTVHHVKNSSPKKVLEIGCLDGVMSYHLGTILGKLHPQSLLYSVADTIGNESNNQWLDFISMIEEMPQLAFAATDYDATNLKDDNFDIVIINGNSEINKTDSVLKEAYRVLRNEGLLICFAQSQPLLESSFQLLFSEREEYFMNYNGRILVTQKYV